MADLYVSIEINIFGNSLTSALMTGMTRRLSSSTAIGSDPGRVDSPPTSKIAAPALTNPCACSTAALTPSPLSQPWERGWGEGDNRPSPEKLSGVTLRTPITYVRAPQSKVKLPTVSGFMDAICHAERSEASRSCPRLLAAMRLRVTQPSTVSDPADAKARPRPHPCS